MSRGLIKKGHYEDVSYFQIGRLRLTYHTRWEEKRSGSKNFLVRRVHVLGTDIPMGRRPAPDEAEEQWNAILYNPLYRRSHAVHLAMEGKITDLDRRHYCEQCAYQFLRYFPDLDHPKRFTEKVAALSWRYRNPAIHIAADKAAAKKYIGDRVGQEHVVPLLGVYDGPEQIDFSSFPDRFVLKLNCGCGMREVIVIRDKAHMDEDKVRAIMSGWLEPGSGLYYEYLCLTDEKIKPRIVAEEYLDQGDGSPVPNDYKFYCCNGEPKFALLERGRTTKNFSVTFTDMNWKILPFTYNHEKIASRVTPPKHPEEMKAIARTLSKDFPLVRVDFYEIGDRVLVGEMTFVPGLFSPIYPARWDEKLGQLLQIPEGGV